MKSEARHDPGNRTTVTEFILVGFPAAWEIEILLFLVFLLIYLCTVAENSTIVFLVCQDNHLHRPMYFLLVNLSIIEVGYVSVTVPKLLANLVSGRKTISFTGCITQLYTFTFLRATECLLLAAMAFDRYIAICNPLRYQSILTGSVCALLVACCWFSGFLTPALPVLFLCLQVFCGPNIINHFFCDASPLLRLSCSDVHVKEVVDFVVSVTVLLTSVVVIGLSYGRIIVTVFRVASTSGRWKAFSTCASHLTVVFIFFGTMAFMYVRTTSLPSVDLNKVVAVFYSVITPMLNPIIYSFRNNEVKRALHKLFFKGS